MGRMKPRITAVALPPYGQEFRAEHDRSRGEVYIIHGASKQRIGKVRLHKAKDCTGTYCVLHRPSDHPLKDAPMTLRLDKNALVERTCEHGVGHDDPDSVEFLIQALGSYADGHGCDGCCTGTTFS